jgi:hypothetical protein
MSGKSVTKKKVEAELWSTYRIAVGKRYQLATNHILNTFYDQCNIVSLRACTEARHAGCARNKRCAICEPRSRFDKLRMFGLTTSDTFPNNASRRIASMLAREFKKCRKVIVKIEEA